MSTSPVRTTGFIILVGGFLWLACDLRLGFMSYQYTRSIWQMQHLPAGDFIPRTEAAGALAEFGVALKDRQQKALVPAIVTFAGGLILGFAPRRNSNATNVA
jgi:hypothetical protein